VVVIGDENDDDSVYVSKANANPNPGKTTTPLFLRTVNEDSKAQNGHS
jgi:hypothetical protein